VHKYSSFIYVIPAFYYTRGSFKPLMLELDQIRKTLNSFYFYCQHLTTVLTIEFLMSEITIRFSHQVPGTRISSTRMHSKRHFYSSASLLWSSVMKQSNIH